MSAAIETLAYTSDEVAIVLGFFKGGKRPGPNGDLVRHLVRSGELPPPTNTRIGVRHWRWSIAEIQAYARGEIKGPWPRLGLNGTEQ